MPETETLAYVKLIYKKRGILNPQGLMALNGVETLTCLLLWKKNKINLQLHAASQSNFR